ncbi:hypothetical protein ACLB2K_058709 [Fragaria x ananassa]
MEGASRGSFTLHLLQDRRKNILYHSTTLLHTDDKVVAFQDIKPAALRHYLVIPVDHIPTVNDLQRRPEDYTLDLAFINHHLTVSTIFTSILFCTTLYTQVCIFGFSEYYALVFFYLQLFIVKTCLSYS